MSFQLTENRKLTQSYILSTKYSILRDFSEVQFPNNIQEFQQNKIISIKNKS